MTGKLTQSDIARAASLRRRAQLAAEMSSQYAREAQRLEDKAANIEAAGRAAIATQGGGSANG